MIARATSWQQAVATLEELEAAMEKAGVPRVEPLPPTRQKSARKRQRA